MITLIVGRPRTGKTYYLVVLLILRLQRLFKNRPVVSNVRGHKGVDHCITFMDDFTSRQYDKSLIILDEVQFYSVRDKSGEMFQHFTVHGHQERDYVWITQSTSALPSKWLGLVERTIKIETVAGSSISRALHYIGNPVRGDEPIESETYRPKKTDLYKTCEDGMTPPKRRMPGKVWFLLFTAILFGVGAPVGAYSMVKHFMNKGTVVSPSDSTKAILERVSSVEIEDSLVIESDEVVLKPSFLHGDFLDDSSHSTLLLRFPMSVDEAVSVFSDEPKVFFGCGGFVFSDKPIRSCDERRATTLEESRSEELQVSVLPRNSFHHGRNY